jgi:hypothetical protein
MYLICSGPGGTGYVILVVSTWINSMLLGRCMHVFGRTPMYVLMEQSLVNINAASILL